MHSIGFFIYPLDWALFIGTMEPTDGTEFFVVHIGPLLLSLGAPCQ